MFIGGGSAGTDGGVKVTTFFVLVLVVWNEILGHQDVEFRGAAYCQLGAAPGTHGGGIGCSHHRPGDALDIAADHVALRKSAV